MIVKVLVCLCLAAVVLGRSYAPIDEIKPIRICPQVSCIEPQCGLNEEIVPGFQDTLGPDGKPCPGCPTCRPIPPPVCPIPLCLKPDCPPEDQVPGFLNVKGPDGKPCPGCPKCKPRRECPVVRCAVPDCPENERIPGFFDIIGPDGKKCPACDECAKPCPFIACPAVVIDCPGGEVVRPLIDNPNSEDQCLGCPFCDRPTIAPPVCPVPGCILPPCKNPKPTFFKGPGGIRCEGCPECPGRKECPLRRCAPLDCERPSFRRRRYFWYHGQRCRDCDTCVKIGRPRFPYGHRPRKDDY